MAKVTEAMLEASIKQLIDELQNIRDKPSRRTPRHIIDKMKQVRKIAGRSMTINVDEQTRHSKMMLMIDELIMWAEGRT